MAVDNDVVQVTVASVLDLQRVGSSSLFLVRVKQEVRRFGSEDVTRQRLASQGGKHTPTLCQIRTGITGPSQSIKCDIHNKQTRKRHRVRALPPVTESHKLCVSVGFTRDWGCCNRLTFDGRASVPAAWLLWTKPPPHSPATP